MRPSELAKSALAEVTPRIMQSGLKMYLEGMSRISFSISLGWSPTGTFINPGKSTSVSVRTLGEKMPKLIGCVEMTASRRVPSSPRVANNLGTNLVEIIEFFNREMKEFASFIFIHSGVGMATDKLHEAKGMVI